MKILFRGGSISSGKGVEKSYVDKLSEDFPKEHPDVSIINVSKDGDSSFDGVWSFRELVSPHSPDILLLHFGVDDAFRPVYRSEFKENLVQMVRLARHLFRPAIYLLTSHPFPDTYEMDALNIYYRTLREVAYDLRCTLIPIHLLWFSYDAMYNSERRPLFLDDCRFPNNSGQELYFYIMRDKLTEFLFS